jgi:hypothetical protein
MVGSHSKRSVWRPTPSSGGGEGGDGEGGGGE